ncbi:MAG: hypothetical protein U1F35_08955 [Steroidobacteraceae bacterium]
MCRSTATPLPEFKGRVVLEIMPPGLNDAGKPTPVDQSRGVQCSRGRQTQSRAMRFIMPPAWLKYALAALMSAFTAFVFFRGEPHSDIDSAFVAANLTLLLAAFIGLVLHFPASSTCSPPSDSSVSCSDYAAYMPRRSAAEPSATAITGRISTRRPGPMAGSCPIAFRADAGLRRKPSLSG